MTLDKWFRLIGKTLEDAYLEHQEPWKQSGMSGPRERWVSLRKPVADCIDKSGSFLDIGCANGYLLECCIEWTAQRHITIIPYGLDLSNKLVELARQRLPQHRANFYVGNAFYWKPPKRFDFVRTELVYVPAEYEKQYIESILQNHLNPGGKLLVANYGEGLPQEQLEKGIIKGSYPASDILTHLQELGFNPGSHQDGHDPVKNRKVRIAILSQT
jgi:SAM-dependent methyltransferase